MKKISTLTRPLLWLASCVVLLILTRAAANGESPRNVGLAEKYGYSQIYDITNKIVPGMTVWGRVDGLPVEKLLVNGTDGELLYRMATHMGTHGDAPGHIFQDMFDKGCDANSLDLRTLNGLALVINAPRNTNITAEVMKFLNIPKGVKRVLFRTENSYRRLMRQSAFYNYYAGFTAEGADWLVKNTDIKLIGMDYLSIAVQSEAEPVHKILLAKGDIIPVEGLQLDAVDPGVYMLHCLPLRIPKADGSPARCILMK